MSLELIDHVLVIEIVSRGEVGPRGFSSNQWAEIEGVPASFPASAHTHGLGDLPGELVVTSDARLGDSRTPTGAAGGVLAGNYPNPGFAVNMATQAELDAVANASATDATTKSNAAQAAAIAAAATDATTKSNAAQAAATSAAATDATTKANAAQAAATAAIDALVFNDISDVIISDPQIGDTLVWDGANWINGASTGGVDIQDVWAQIPSP